jgi:hypothetical protein
MTSQAVLLNADYCAPSPGAAAVAACCTSGFVIPLLRGCKVTRHTIVHNGWL